MAGLRRLILAAAAALLVACNGPGDAESTAPPATGEPQAASPTAPVAPSPSTPTPDAPTSGETTSPPEGDPTEVAVELTTVASGLQAPWEIVVTGNRTFLTERDTGAVLELLADGSTEEIATLEIDPAGEGGLLGLAADPAADGLGFYAYLTGPADNRVVRFAPGEDPEPVLTGIPKARVHDGGRIAFGPDRLLYVATGDAGQPELAQDPSSLAGKILRLTPDGGIPVDNPTPGSPVYSLGHRNPQGLAWTADGTLYAAEFGPDRDDEVNRIEPGANYGWPEVTGQAGAEGFVDPVFVQQPPDASWSGLAVLDGGAIPQWEGDLFLAALRGERLWRLSLAEDGSVASAEALLTGELGRIRQVVQAPDGALWLLTSNRDGRGNPAADDDRVLRLGPPARR